MGSALPRPAGLDDRGAQLWKDVTSTAALDHAGLVLLEEACRAADRLERLHLLLTGDTSTWASLVTDEVSDELTIKVNGPLVEARQQQQTFRALLGQLKLGRVSMEDPAARRDVVDELTSRRRRRGAATSDPDGAARE